MREKPSKGGYRWRDRTFLAAVIIDVNSGMMGLCGLGLLGGETDRHHHHLHQPVVSVMCMSSASGVHLEWRPGPLRTNALAESCLCLATLRSPYSDE